MIAPLPVPLVTFTSGQYVCVVDTLVHRLHFSLLHIFCFATASPPPTDTHTHPPYCRRGDHIQEIGQAGIFTVCESINHRSIVTFFGSESHT